MPKKPTDTLPVETPAPATVAIETVTPSVALVTEPAPAPTHRVQDLAQHLIHNYNPKWWPSIAARAKADNIGEHATIETIKELFTRWGAVLKK